MDEPLDLIAEDGPLPEDPAPGSSISLEPGPGPGPVESGCVLVEPVRDESGGILWEATRAKVQDAYAGFPPSDLGVPAWEPAYNQLWAQERERAVLEQLAATGRQIEGRTGLAVTDWPLRPPGHGGYLVDEQRALDTPCIRIDLGEGSYLTFSRGIVGALSEPEEQRYCLQGYVEQPATPTEQQQLRALADAAEQCWGQAKGLPPEQHLEAYYSCLGKELRERGGST